MSWKKKKPQNIILKQFYNKFGWEFDVGLMKS